MICTARRGSPRLSARFASSTVTSAVGSPSSRARKNSGSARSIWPVFT
jgi:hypothetical protein